MIRFERGGCWTGDLLFVDTEDPKTMPPSEINIKRFKSKWVDILKGFPCRTDEISQEGQPLSTVVYKAESDFKRESQQNSSEEKEEARDLDPDVEARRDF